MKLRLVDDDGRPIDAADDETVGEIQVRGPNLFLELPQPARRHRARRCATAGFAPATWPRATGDGYVRIVGRRATDLIKSGGYKIGAGEIEGALREHPAVADAAVTGEPDEDLGERVVAWVVLRDGAPKPPEPELVGPRRGAARPPQAPARRAVPRAAAAQRAGQGAEEAPHR